MLHETGSMEIGTLFHTECSSFRFPVRYSCRGMSGVIKVCIRHSSLINGQDKTDKCT